MRTVKILLITAVTTFSAFGDDAVQLTSDPADDYYPSWSPDGTIIAFSSKRTTVFDIYTIPASGGTATRLTYDSSAEVYPEWSPDGQTIVYYRSSGNELFKVPSSGGTSTRFTYNDYFDGGPSWSNDNTKIAFFGHYSKKGETGMQYDDSIFWIPADDGTATPNLIISGWDNFSPEWAPDNSDKITLTRNPGSLPQIWVKTLGGSAYPVTNDSYDNVKSSWSPWGQYLTYGSDRNGNDDIWIIPAMGGTPIQVTDDPASDFHPAWSPNGDKIVFTSGRSGNYDIWVIDISGLVNIESASLGEIKAHFATDEMKGK